MAKKVNILASLYLVGMVLVLAGSFLPFSSVFGSRGASAASVIGRGGVLSLGALLTLVGAAAGLVLCFLSLPARRLLKLVALGLSLAGGIYVAAHVSGGVTGSLLKFAAKTGIASMSVGFYVIAAGWILALTGWFLAKD